MIKYDLTYKKNLNKIEFNKRNVINFSTAESIRHFNKKCEVCYLLRKSGLEFITEARLKTGLGRIDIYLPIYDIAIEIIDSEKELKEYKTANYNVKKIVSIYSDEIIYDINKKL